MTAAVTVFSGGLLSGRITTTRKKITFVFFWSNSDTVLELFARLHGGVTAALPVLSVC